MAGYFAELPPKERRGARKSELEKTGLFTAVEIETILNEMEKQKTLDASPPE